ncbi:MAG: hypothetical protein AAFN77_02255 [Planctomycetota bacterium]
MSDVRSNLSWLNLLESDKINNKDALRPKLIVSTIELLHQRIGERFPDAGLRDVCKQVLVIARNMEQRAIWISRPVLWLRILTYSVIFLIVVAAMLVMWNLGQKPIDELFNGPDSKDILELIESGINDILLIGAAIFFLLTVEPKYKRQRALKAMHELRSLAHVIDMHQLTKDPHRIICEESYDRKKLSPKLTMTRFELHRYLDYCSEMLALIGKIAAVYVQDFDDGVAMATASELETLTTGLSRKIWQKIAILTSTTNPYEQEKSTKQKPLANELQKEVEKLMPQRRDGDPSADSS